MAVIDTHVHLNFPEFREDLEAVISRSTEQGVITMINIGTDLTTSRESVQLADRYDQIYAAVGVHPHSAKDFADQARELAQLARHPRVVAIGEVGLDYFRDYSPHPDQIAAFKAQLDLALEVKKPIIIHCRDAYTELLAIVEEHYIPRLNGRAPGIIHSFAANAAVLQRFLKLGFFVGINNMVTYPKNELLAEAVKQLPLERLVLETDCPYLPPQSKKGQRCEPADVMSVAAKVAELKNTDIIKITQTSIDNVHQLFQFNG